MKNQFEKWNGWLDSIYEEIRDLCICKHIFFEIKKMIENNPKIQKPNVFYGYFSFSNTSLVLMGIRRQIKIDRKSISFARLLKEISENPYILSRTRYVSLYNNCNKIPINGSLIKHLANEYFDKFSGKSNIHVDPEMVKKDLNDLQKKAKLCEKFADKTIAHHDINRPKTILSSKDVNDCIDFLEELMKKYYALFRAQPLLSTTPTIISNWKAIFKEPWIPD